VGQGWQVGVAVAVSGAAVGGVAQDGASAVGLGVVEDVVDVPVGVVVGEDRRSDAVGAFGDAGLGEVVRGGVDAVGVVAYVGAAVAVAVDAHAGPGGGHELHQAECSCRAGVVVPSVSAFLHADPGEQGPGHLVPEGCGDVEGFDLGWDGQWRVGQAGAARRAGAGEREPDPAVHRRGGGGGCRGGGGGGRV